jgi:ribokinase
MKQPTILVVGSANMDLVVKAPRIPVPGETILGGSFARVRGGKGANQAVACSRLGAQTFMLGRVGTDSFGDELLEGLQSDGVCCRLMIRDEEAASGIAIIVIDGGGENAIVVAPGANGRVSPADIDPVRGLSGIDAVLCQLEVPVDAVEAALDAAREAGVMTVLDAAPPTALPASLLAKVDVLTPNQTEACAILGLPVDACLAPEEAAARLLETGARQVVLKLGADGALAAWDGGMERVPSFPIEPVDTTGAGDAFTAALAVNLASGKDLVAATTAACAAGALAATVFGAAPSMPTAEAVAAFMKAHGRG